MNTNGNQEKDPKTFITLLIVLICRLLFLYVFNNFVHRKDDKNPKKGNVDD